MKIAYLANVRIPSERAHSTQIVHMCQAFSEVGNDVDLYASTRVTDSKEAIDKLYNITSKFNLYRVNFGIFNPNIKITFYISELIFTFNFFMAKKPSYDLFYTRSEWIAWLLSFFVSKSKIIWESHEAKMNLPARRLLKQKIKTVCISEGIAQVYNKYTKNIIVAHDGIDDSFFGILESKSEARIRLGIQSKKPIVMYIGGLEKWKGIETFCLASLTADSFQFVVIGGNKKSMFELQQKYSDVLFLGSLPYPDLPNNQQAADILVIPNTAQTELSSLYTSPLKLFAHMTSCVPIVLSKVTSLESVVDDDKVTFFTPDNPDSFVSALKDVWSNYDAKFLDAKKLHEYSKQYLWTVRAKKIINFVS